MRKKGKKISWWESKYSDFTRKEYEESCTVFYLKKGVEVGKTRNKSLLKDTEESGEIVKLVTYEGNAYIFMSLERLQDMMENLPDEYFDHSSTYL